MAILNDTRQSTGSVVTSTSEWTEQLTTGQLEVGNRIDRLMTVEIRPSVGGLPFGIVVPMYDVCRAHVGAPLSITAAAALKGRVTPGSTVLIATGAGVPPKLPYGETDGPPGAAALATALAKGLQARVVIVTEVSHFPPIEAAVHVANSRLREGVRVEDGQTTGPIPIEIMTFPIGLNAGHERARVLMEMLCPSAVVFIERDGPNVEGQFHGVRGDCRDPSAVGHVYLLAYHATEAGVLTIGIGDGGNEVGFGAVRESIRSILPNRGQSLAGYKSGVVTVVATDIIVSASVSNWGAYAVAAALAVLLNDMEVLHDSRTEEEMVIATVEAGARDGATSILSQAVDGIDLDGHLAFVRLLQAVAIALAHRKR